MSRLTESLLFAGALATAGCGPMITTVRPETNAIGDVWYATSSLGGETHIYYCPKPAGAGPVTCKEAKYVAAGK
jgi:hypothetical protein